MIATWLTVPRNQASQNAPNSEKWVEYPPDVLPLFVAEMDYPLAPAVASAITERIALSDTGYVASPLPVGEAPIDATLAAAQKAADGRA